MGLLGGWGGGMGLLVLLVWWDGVVGWLGWWVGVVSVVGAVGWGC